MNNRLKELRNTLGLTMDRFGSQIGVKKNTVSQWESGTNSLTEPMIKAICNEYNVNEQWLRTGEGDMFVQLDKEEQLMQWAGKMLAEESDSFKKRFVSMLIKLDTEDWKALEKIALKLKND